jgi:quaternary ammonium compound-resistance protein SugE
MTAWTLLFLAGLFEIGFVACMKLSDGMTRLWWAAASLLLGLVSVLLLNLASKSIPIGTAYALWTGMGAVGAVAIGMIWFGDPTEWRRLFFLALLIGSLIGLRLVSPNTGE